MTTASKRPSSASSRASPCRIVGLRRPVADARERLDPRERVERVSADEVLGALDRAALALVLEAPVRADLRLLREVEVEVRRQARRPRRAGQHDPEDVGVLVVADQRAEGEQLGGRLRREPLADVATSGAWHLDVSRRDKASRISLSRTNSLYRAVLTPTSRQLKAATSTPTAAVAALERLDERRPGAGERVEHAPARRHVPREQDLDELRDELAEVRVEPVDVLRPLALGQVALGPRELEVDVRVESILRPRHRT